jgi:hypothetical protein
MVGSSGSKNVEQTDHRSQWRDATANLETQKAHQSMHLECCHGAARLIWRPREWLAELELLVFPCRKKCHTRPPTAPNGGTQPQIQEHRKLGHILFLTATMTREQHYGCEENRWQRPPRSRSSLQKKIRVTTPHTATVPSRWPSSVAPQSG